MTTSRGILLADDHALVRRGVRLILEEHEDLRVVAEASDGVEAVRLAQDPAVELAVLDVAMPRMTGLHAAREISRVRPGLPMLILSMHDNEQYFFESLAVGAAGYVLKSVADRDLVAACRDALEGKSYLYPGIESRLLRDHLDRLARGEQVRNAMLTPREEEVVKLVAEGHQSHEIADLLVISIKTVERHRENVLAKLGMRDRTELTRYAIRVGLVEP